MGIALIILDLFLWFALEFNGSVGEPFVNYSFFISALLMVITGLLKIANSNWEVARIFCAAALVFYLPMIWQRFNFEFSTATDGPELYFDIGILIFMLIFITRKPNNPIKSGAPKSGAP